MDKAAIFTDLTRRNALRKANGLPLLDVHAEYPYEIFVARQRAYRVACDAHADERDAIRHQVLVEYQDKYGPRFGRTTGGRLAVGQLAQKRFETLMAEKYSVIAPDRTAGRHAATTYGAGANRQH